MPLIQYRTSIDRKRAFEAGLLHLVELGRVSPGLATNPYVQPIHIFGLRDILAKQIKAGANPVSWRYFATNASKEEVVAGDVDVSSPPKLTNLRYGVVAKSMLEVTDTLEEHLPELNDESYELRILRIPGFLVEAFWLTPMTEELDSLVVLAPYYKTLIESLDDRGKWTMTNFLETVRSDAAKTLAFKNSPPPAAKPHDPYPEREEH
jgi:hypothetical protein